MSTTAGDFVASNTATDRQPLTPAALAWIALLPCSALAVASIVLLGPPLGHVLFAPGSDALWPAGWWEATGHAEPTKHARYLLAVLAPILLAAAVLVGTRRGAALPPRIARALVVTSQAAVAGCVAALLLRQNVLYDVGQPAPPVFGLVSAAVAAALVSIGLFALRRRAVAARVAELVRETPTRRAVTLAVVVALTATWLLKVLMTDKLTGDLVGLNIPFTMNDASAVLNGRTPLVDYHAIYAKLLPYSTALMFAAFGSTIFVFTLWMASRPVRSAAPRKRRCGRQHRRRAPARHPRCEHANSPLAVVSDRLPSRGARAEPSRPQRAPSRYARARRLGARHSHASAISATGAAGAPTRSPSRAPASARCRATGARRSPAAPARSVARRPSWPCRAA